MSAQPASLPAIIRSVERLAAEIEQAVSAFPRRHRYALGQDLRNEAVALVVHVHKAFRATKHRALLLSILKLIDEVLDSVKVRIRIAKRLQCCSGGRFELLAKLAVDVGRQVGGWQRQHMNSPSGQSSTPQVRQPGRAQTLSTPAASAEAKR